MAAQHESFKRIADYLEIIKDKTWAINVNVAAPQITVTPATPTVTVQPLDLTALINAINQIGSTDLTALIAAITGLQLSPQITVTGGSGGGCDGNCGGTCGDLMCVMAPMAAGILQGIKPIINLGRSSGSWSENGRAWPDPSMDSDPPMDYTPYPDGGTVPPGFTYPPGGMNGGYDPVGYAGYRCDIAWYIVDCLIFRYEAIAEQVGYASTVLDALTMLDRPERMWASMRAKMTVQVVYDVVANPTTLVEAGVKATSKSVLAVISALLEILNQELPLLQSRIGEHVTLLQSRKKAMVCALLDGTTAPDAVSRLNQAAGKFWVPTFNVGQTYNGVWGGLNTAILGSLPQNLFACEAGYDFTSIEGYSTIYGDGCEGCDFSCDGATLIIDFDLGKQGWFTLNPPDPDTSYGEIIGLGTGGDPDPEMSLGVSGFLRNKSIRIESTRSFTFTQVCVKYGGQSVAGNNTVNVYVGGLLAMTKTANIDSIKHYEVVTMNIEEDKIESYPNEDLLNNKFHGTVSIERYIGGGNAAGGQGRIFGVAFGEMSL